MAESENILQKAFYLGVGMAGYALEKANDKFQEFTEQVEQMAKNENFSQQIQQIADEMANKGKISAEEARNFVEKMMKQVQPPINQTPKNSDSPSKPRTIEIISDDD